MIEFMNRVLDFFKPKAKQTCWTWCPECENELTSCKYTVYTVEKSIVSYVCGNCDNRVDFDFGPPAPIMIKNHAEKLTN